VDIIGPALERHYALPAAGEREGFGMGEGHRHSVSIWTSLLQPETAEVRISLPKAPAGLAGGEKIADFTFKPWTPTNYRCV